jgi:hypothetical protein
MKMVFLKNTINLVTPRIRRMTEGVQAKTPQAELISRVWARVMSVWEKDNVIELYGDNNFQNLLLAVRDALIFLCENDRYYKRWLGLLSFLMSEELEKMFQEFSYEKALNMTVRPLALGFEEYEKHKRALFGLHMSGYLKALNTSPGEIIEQLKKAKEEPGEKYGSVKFETEDPDAYVLSMFHTNGEINFTMILRDRYEKERKEPIQ